MCALTAQVTAIGEKIKGMAGDGKSGDRSDDILVELDALNDIQFSKELLGSTRIASVVGPLRSKSPNSEVRKRANELFNKWLDVAKNTQKSGPVRAISNEQTESKRKKRRDFLHDELMKFAGDMPIDVRRLASDIEAAVFGHSDHEERFVMLMGGLTEAKKLEEFRYPQRLLSGDISPERFAALEKDDFLTEDRRKEIERNREEAMKQSLVPKPAAAKSSLFKCRRCGSDNVTFYQQQTRSCDEPMTNFCKCGKCGNEWRE
jgi:transcription elongation factor S-II